MNIENNNNRALGAMPAVTQVSTVTSVHPDTLPLIGEWVYDNLPDFLQQITSLVEHPRERDLLLISALTTLSSTMGKVESVYDAKNVYPNLFAYIVGKAAKGKGRMDLCHYLVKPIHQELLAVYRQEKQTYDLAPKKKSLPQPHPRMHCIPGNSSVSAVINALAANHGCGIIIESETDTVSNTFKNDWGGYSELLRKAGQNENASKLRVMDGYSELALPKLAMLITSTEGQIAGIIPSAENGLFSRFLFYYMSGERRLRNPYARRTASLNTHFEALGVEYYAFYQQLQALSAVRFESTVEQGEQIMRFMQRELERTEGLYDQDALDATILRNGLMAHRIFVVLTMLCCMDTERIPTLVQGNDMDLDIALEIVRVSLAHTEYIMRMIPSESSLAPIRRKNNSELLYEALPPSFRTAQAIEAARAMGIDRRKLFRWIKSWETNQLLHRLDHAQYQKVSPCTLDTLDTLDTDDINNSQQPNACDKHTAKN